MQAVRPACGEIIHDPYFVAPSQQCVGKVRADKTGTASHNYAHDVTSCLGSLGSFLLSRWIDVPSSIVRVAADCSSATLMRERVGGIAMITISASTYHQYGTSTAALVTGHHSDIGAVATSLRKCADTPQAAPASMYTAVEDAGVLARCDQ